MVNETKQAVEDYTPDKIRDLAVQFFSTPGSNLAGVRSLPCKVLAELARSQEFQDYIEAVAVLAASGAPLSRGQNQAIHMLAQRRNSKPRPNAADGKIIEVESDN